jgi:hypothetical protein
LFFVYVDEQLFDHMKKFYEGLSPPKEEEVTTKEEEVAKS